MKNLGKTSGKPPEDLLYLAPLELFRKMLHFGKIPKKIGKKWAKFSKILAKFAKFWKKNRTKFSDF